MRLPKSSLGIAVACLAIFPAPLTVLAAESSAQWAIYPRDGAADVPPDAQLRLPFDPRVTRFEVRDDTGRTIAEIPVGDGTAVTTVGGFEGYRYFPVIRADDFVVVTLPRGTLRYGHQYSVLAMPSMLAGKALTLNFQTRSEAIPHGRSHLTVAPDGSGDFATIQAALDYVPEHNSTPITIDVRRGTYLEIIAFAHKDHVTLRGADRKATILEYRTNDRLNPTGGNPYGGTDTPDHESSHVYHRGVLLAHRDADFALENLTIRNLTPHGGSQSECIIFNGTDSARAIVRDVDLYSFQDTLQINGQAYVAHSYIEGDVDFMWGTGACFFEDCTARSVRSGAYYTQIRNPGTKHGFVYYHCTFAGPPGVTGNYLSRIEPGRFPHSEVVLIDCTLGPAVGAVAWQLQGRNAPATAPVHFWEYASHAPDGSPVDVSHRHKTSRQLHEPEDAKLIRDYSDPAWVLGGGWNPRNER